MRRRMTHDHLHFDAMTQIEARREPVTRLPKPPHDPRPGLDARTDRHRTRALLHDAERGGEADDLVA